MHVSKGSGRFIGSGYIILPSQRPNADPESISLQKHDLDHESPEHAIDHLGDSLQLTLLIVPLNLALKSRCL